MTSGKDLSAVFHPSEDLFRALTQILYDGIALLDANAVYLYCGPSITQITGYAPEEMYGRCSLDFFHPDDRESAKALLAEALARPGVPTKASENRRQHRDGSYRVIETICVNLLDNPAVKAIVAICRDITEKKRVEEDLRSREERLRTIVEAAYEGIWMIDEKGRSTFANQRMADMLGYSAEEIGGRPIIEFVRPEAGSAIPAPPKFLHADTEPREVQFLRKEGTAIWTLVSSRILHAADGRYAGAVVMASDLTAHRKLEEQLRHAQKMEAVGRLAGGVAHDFSNLLAVIMVNADLVAEALGSNHPLRAEIEEIRSASERASGLTTQLLAFSRQQFLQPRVISINQVIGDMEKMLRRLMGEDIEITTELTPRLGFVHVDPIQLGQVVMNLIINARDAMPYGGRLTLKTEGVEVEEPLSSQLGLPKPGSYVRLTVTDTGTGMDAETRSRLFEPFFTTKQSGKGTGLGLATAFGIVRQSGGAISVSSEPGKGTTFLIYFPRVDVVPEAATPSLEASTPKDTAAETVLVVEDDDAVRAVICRALRARGYAVLEAGNGEAAVERVKSGTHPIHLLLTDIVMPGGDGRGVAQRVRELVPNIKVIFISGHTEHPALKGAGIGRGDYLLRKPFHVREITALVRRVLDSPRV